MFQRVSTQLSSNNWTFNAKTKHIFSTLSSQINSKGALPMKKCTKRGVCIILSNWEYLWKDVLALSFVYQRWNCNHRKKRTEHWIFNLLDDVPLNMLLLFFKAFGCLAQGHHEQDHQAGTSPACDYESSLRGNDAPGSSLSTLTVSTSIFSPPSHLFLESFP